jgi:hypothetical protein
VRKRRGKGLLGIPMCRWADNRKTGRTGSMGWIDLAEDRDRRRVLNAVIKPLGCVKWEFLD